MTANSNNASYGDVMTDSATVRSSSGPRFRVYSLEAATSNPLDAFRTRFSSASDQPANGAGCDGLRSGGAGLSRRRLVFLRRRDGRAVLVVSGGTSHKGPRRSGGGQSRALGVQRVRGDQARCFLLERASWQSAYGALRGSHSQRGRLIKELAHELDPGGVAVNTVPPGFVDTPMLQRSEDTGLLGEGDQSHLATMRADCGGTPADTAAARAHLVREHACCITGHLVAVDGGRVVV